MFKRPRFLVPVVALLARITAAQATVSGTVRDSLEHRPLADATVQLVAFDDRARLGRSVMSDSLGRFSFADVPSGRYLIGFIHPLLDSLGIEPVSHEIRVDGTRAVRIDLATPAASQLRVAICTASAEGRHDPGAAIVGTVRDARREPISEAAVTAEWLEVSIGVPGIRWNTARRSVTSAPNGRFALCGTPGAGTIFLSAARDGVATGTIMLTIPADSLIRRDLYLDAGRHARVQGVVTDADGSPIAGVQVAMTGAPPVRTDIHGEWTVTDAPGGTRTLELRAVGYSPEQLAMDVVDGAPPLRVALASTRALLDTMRINAGRDLAGISGFEERRRSTTGHFLTGDDVRRHAIVGVSDALRWVPGLTLDRMRDSAQLRMRSMADSLCMPSVFVDGRYMSNLEADQIDALLPPDAIAGIEVYGSDAVPAQFAQGNFGFDWNGHLKAPCGAIVVWTKPTSRWYGNSWVSVLTAAAVVGTGLLLGAVLAHTR